MRPGALQLAARLCEALRGEEEDMVEDLLRRGADPNLILPEGIAAIHLAAGMEQESGTRCLSLILQYGGDPSVRSVDDLTPLHVAASWGCCTCLRLLLISGGDPRLEDQDGNTAMDLALEHGNEMCIRILQRYLEKPGEEQNFWIQQRRAESFLTTLTEDVLGSTNTSMLSEDEPLSRIIKASKSSPNQTLQHVGPGISSYCYIPGNSQQRNGIENLLSSSFLTEDSQERSTLCNLHDESESPSSTLFSFGSVYGKLASDQAAMQGSPDELELSMPKAQHGTTQSHCMESTSDDGCLCPDQNITFPCASLTDFPSQKSRASPEVPNASGSPPTCVIQDECKVDCPPRTQDADASLDLSHYKSFLVPDLMMKVTAQEGLDVTSPDHAYLFCRANSTTVSDLEKTVVDPALLLKMYGDPGERAVEDKLVSSSGEGSSLYNTAVLETTSSVIGDPTSSNKSQGKLKGSVPPESVAELNKEERKGSGEGSDLSLSLQDMEEKTETLVTQDTVPIQNMCAFSGGECSDTMTVQHQTLSNREEEFADLDVKLRKMMLSTKVFHSPELQADQRPCHVTPRTKSRMTSSSIRSSDGSSLFDQPLEMPSRQRRVRSPKGKTPASGEVKNQADVLQNESLSCHMQDEISSLEDTLLIVAEPSNCKQSIWPKSSSLGTVIPSPAPLTNSGKKVCTGNGWLDVKLGTECSASLEATCILEEDKCLPEDKDGVCTAEVIPDALSTWAKPERPGARCNRANPSRVSFSKLPAGELTCVPGISSRPSGRLSPISQDVSLSPGGRPVNLNATEPVEYLYVDEDRGHALVERHVPCTDDSIASTASSEDTVIYDWRGYANQVDKQSSKESSPMQLSSEVRLLSDQALVKKLRDFGVNPGPVTGLTRNVYMKLLEKLMNDPNSKARKGSAGYSPELCSALETYQIPDGKDDEMALAHQFDQPDKSKKWREGLLKSSFNYLLLDPRVTQNLPFRCQYTSQAECFRTFVSAIFYVGKGKRSRPYSHLYEALTHYKKSWRTQHSQVCSKVQHILEIWASGQGVISMHCFQNVIPVEAYTREACMVDAMGLKMLTNQKKGNYYGIVAGWPMRRRQCLGVHLLHRAMQIFLAEGERQLRPTDICMGQ